MPNFPNILIEHLGADRSNAVSYLLADTSAIPARELQQSFRSAPALDVLRCAPPDWQTCVSPVLVLLPALDDRAAHRWKEFATSWQDANALQLIDSPLPHAALCQALHARTEALLPDALSVVLRYFDNRILHAMLTTLEPSRRAAFLSIATCWIYSDRSGDAVSIHAAPAGEDTFAGPLELSPKQEQALIDAGEADALIDVLLKHDNSGLAALPSCKQHALVSRMLHTARSFGITGFPEQRAYCEIAIAHGEHFHASAEWQPMLEPLKAGRETFTETFRGNRENDGQ